MLTSKVRCIIKLLMPFVHNCICNCMQCKQYAITFVKGGANGRWGGAKQKKSKVSSLNGQLMENCHCGNLIIKLYCICTMTAKYFNPQLVKWRIFV